MDPLLNTYFGILGDLHDEGKKQISDLAQDALDWSPGAEMNSIAVLAAHTAGAETFWITEIVMETPAGRDRNKEFATSGKDAVALAGLLDGSLARVQEAFESLASANLLDQRVSPLSAKEITVAWAIARTIRHTALHLGHIEITRQLLDARKSERD